MLRRFGAAISVMALLCGFATAPYTHVHQSAGGPGDVHDHGSWPAALLHAHVTPHSGPDSHHPPFDGDQDVEQQIWSVGGFVFQPASTAQPPLPALPVRPVTSAVPTGSRLGVTLTQPNAHAPPVMGGCNFRAPPFVPAAIS